jgi:hypothetical protein
MRNLTLSEMMHTLPLGDFHISGDFNKDVDKTVPGTIKI